jgi:hypothetical protein
VSKTKSASAVRWSRSTSRKGDFQIAHGGL